MPELGGELTIPRLEGALEKRTNTLGINDRGDIVGRFCVRAPCRAPGSGDYRGFLLSAGDLTAIDFPGALSTIAFGINARRDVVGFYFDARGEAHGFLLGWRKQNKG